MSTAGSSSDPDGGPGSPDEVSVKAGPYVGLVPYAESDAAFFFGRDGEREIITANLMASRLTVLYGASGVGKTSVLRAGVAHHLRQQSATSRERGDRPDSAIVVFRSWRDDPASELLLRTGEAVQESLGRQTAPSGAATSLGDGLRAWGEVLGGNLFLILDQFEEYFVYHDVDAGAGTWADEFPLVVTTPDLRVNVLISIREDALSKLDRFKPRIPGLLHNYLRIDHLDLEAARQAIESPLDKLNRMEPARTDTISIEPELVEAVLSQVQTGRFRSATGGLGVAGTTPNGGGKPRIETPYLQLVMSRLWDEERAAGSNVLQLVTLERLGGAERIVRTHLDAALATLPVSEQNVAARAFRYLVTPSGSKIAHTPADLAEYAGIRETELAPVLDELAGGTIRVLRPVAPPPERPATPRYEIFHDVLAEPILDWRTRFERTETERRLESEKRQAQAEAAKERRRARVFRALALGLVVLTALAVVLAVIAVRSERRAVLSERAAERAQGEALIAASFANLSNDPLESLRDALEAHDLVPGPGATEALRRSLFDSRLRAVLGEHDGPVVSAAFSADGGLVVTAGEDGTARIWNPTTGEQTDTIDQPGTEPLVMASFFPDGSRVLLADRHTVSIWDPANGIVTLGDFEPAVVNAALSPNGSQVLVVAGTSASIVEVSSGQRLTLGDVGQLILNGAFSIDGTKIVTAGYDGEARFWDATTGDPVLEPIRGALRPLFVAAFSPDTKRVVTAGETGVARILDVKSHRIGPTLDPHEGALDVAAFSVDGTVVLTSGRASPPRVWDAVTGAQLLSLGGEAQQTSAAALSPDGTIVVTGGEDGTVRVWSADVGFPLGSDTDAASFSPDGTRIVTSRSDGTAQVWNATTGESLGTFGQPGTPLLDVALGARGTQGVTAAEGGPVRLWDVATGALRLDLPTSRFFDLSRDGDRLVTLDDEDGEGEAASVWDVATGQLIRTVGELAPAFASAAFSPDGAFIVTTGLDDATARIWEVATGRLVQTLEGSAFASEAAFSPDGSHVLTSGPRGTWLWDVSSGDSARIDTSAAGANAFSFTPDGERLATIAQDGSRIDVRDTTTRRSLASIDVPFEVVTVAFSSDGRWLVGAGNDRTAWVWETTTWRTAAVIPLRTDSIDDVSFGAGDRILALGARHIAEVHTCTTCRPLPELLTTACAELARLDPDAAQRLETCS